MPLYDDFPYTNFHSLNLDWIVKKLSELENGESTEESSSTATLAHNLSGNYPYTNFHSLNLDWIIRSMVGLESDFENVTDRMSAVETEWRNLSTTGMLTDQVKIAILQCFANVAWANDQGQQYYNALYDVFFPPVIVNTLTAVLEQGERVFHVGEDINNIKDYLTVTAELSNDTTITVPAAQYILSGSLSQEGPNIITVSYMNASTTITVNAIAVNLVSISAIYTQSGAIYETDTLDSLKSDLVVTATYSDSSTATVPSADYTLSGTLTEGTSTITVSYGNQTTTFTVTVSPAPTPQVVTAINLPYGAYIDTEYVPTSVNHKYQLGVQLLSSETPPDNTWFAGMNRLPQSTTGAEEYWHLYFGTGNQANSKNDTFIQWNIGAYAKGLTSGNLRTSDSTSNKGSLITQTPFYIRIANGSQQIRANEAMTETLTSGDFAWMGSQTAYNAVTAENPIDSFFIGKLNQKGLRTVTEYQGGVKIFCFRVFDENDTLLVDMHPAVFDSDIGMYDSVRNEFYTASGTGATYDE